MRNRTTLLGMVAAICLAGCPSMRSSEQKLRYTEETGILDAAANGRPESIRQWIQRGESVMSRDADGNTPLHIAADHGHYEAVVVLLENGAAVDALGEKGSTPLHEAAAMGDADTVRLLLERGANVRAVDALGYTPLHYAAEMRNFEMAEIQRAMGLGSNYEWKEDNLEVAKLLISRGADINARDMHGRTPLQRTTPWNHLPVAELLVSSGADIDLADNDGKTPLQHAKEKGARHVAALLSKR